MWGLSTSSRRRTGGRELHGDSAERACPPGAAGAAPDRLGARGRRRNKITRNLRGFPVSSIEAVLAREIRDPRGNPTVEGEGLLADRTEAHAAEPSGASTGQAKAVQLRG